MFLCESKSTLFGLPKVDAIRNHWLRFVYNSTAQHSNAFYGRQFCKHSQVKSSHLYLYSAFNNTNCDKATAQYQNGKIVSIM